MVENNHDTQFHMWGRNSNAYMIQLIYRWNGNFIRIDIALRTRI